MLLAVATAGAATAPDDRFIAGYAAAVLEREFGLTGAAITVRDGVLDVTVPGLRGLTADRLNRALATIPGVRSVAIAETSAGRQIPVQPPPATAAAPAATTAATLRAKGLQLLPGSTLFEPLRADPRWPHFSAAYQHATDQSPHGLEDIAAVSFGDTLALVRGEGLGGQWEVEFQAGVFSVFDLGSDSFDLVNTDFRVGLPLAYRRGPFSALLRLYHQSSHLGDEFLLRSAANRAGRVNLSYETVDALLSYDLGEDWRVYGGAGYLVDRDPDDLKPWTTQAGLEYESAGLLWNALRPVAALDVQPREENGWNPDFSLRAGFELANPSILGHRLEILAEYYNGSNPNGQFLTEDQDYFGVGLHLFLD